MNIPTRKYLLITCAFFLCLLSFALYIIQFAPGAYGEISVSEINESTAINAIVVHLNDSYLEKYPLVYQMLSRNRPDQVEVSQDEYHTYCSEFIWYGPRFEPRYFEYRGRFYAITCPVI